MDFHALYMSLKHTVISKIPNQIRDKSNKKALYYLTGRLLQALMNFTSKTALITEVTNIPKT